MNAIDYIRSRKPGDMVQVRYDIAKRKVASYRVVSVSDKWMVVAGVAYSSRYAIDDMVDRIVVPDSK